MEGGDGEPQPYAPNPTGRAFADSLASLAHAKVGAQLV